MNEDNSIVYLRQPISFHASSLPNQLLQSIIVPTAINHRN